MFADIDLPAAEAAAESSKDLATHPSYRALALSVDVADPQSVEAMVAQTVSTFGAIDYSVNSAGVGCAPRLSVTVSGFVRVLRRSADARCTTGGCPRAARGGRGFDAGVRALLASQRSGDAALRAGGDQGHEGAGADQRRRTKRTPGYRPRGHHQSGLVQLVRCDEGHRAVHHVQARSAGADAERR